MDLKLDPFLRDKTLVFTVTTNGYKYFTWNLYQLFQKRGLSIPLCILCLDKESYDFFQRIAFIPTRLYRMEGQNMEQRSPAAFGSSTFKRFNRMKLKALQELSQRSDIQTLIYIDSDIAVFHDFLPSIKCCLSECPLWFQCDEAREDDFTCSSVDTCPNKCTGIIAMDLNDISRPQFHQLYSISDMWKTAVTDQDYINDRLKTLSIASKTLPRDRFPNGRLLQGDMYKTKEPYLLHFNYLMANQKEQMMKKKNCWLLTL